MALFQRRDSGYIEIQNKKKEFYDIHDVMDLQNVFIKHGLSLSSWGFGDALQNNFDFLLSKLRTNLFALLISDRGTPLQLMRETYFFQVRVVTRIGSYVLVNSYERREHGVAQPSKIEPASERTLNQSVNTIFELWLCDVFGQPLNSLQGRFKTVVLHSFEKPLVLEKKLPCIKQIHRTSFIEAVLVCDITKRATHVREIRPFTWIPCCEEDSIFVTRKRLDGTVWSWVPASLSVLRQCVEYPVMDCKSKMALPPKVRAAVSQAIGENTALNLIRRQSYGFAAVVAMFTPSGSISKQFPHAVLYIDIVSDFDDISALNENYELLFELTNGIGMGQMLSTPRKDKGSQTMVWQFGLAGACWMRPLSTEVKNASVLLTTFGHVLDLYCGGAAEESRYLDRSGEPYSWTMISAAMDLAPKLPRLLKEVTGTSGILGKFMVPTTRAKKDIFKLYVLDQFVASVLPKKKEVKRT